MSLARTSGTIAADPDPNSVEISGPNPIGGTLTGHGVQTGKGVALLDTTTPSWQQDSATGGISTYDAKKVKNSSQLPGKLVVSPDSKIRDAEAMAAQALSRDVYDYYASLGRDSWDGQGGSMVSTVHYGPSDFCNSFFTSSLRQPQMVYGNPCTTAQGQAEVTEVEIDTAGHEITHGVTATSAGLKYTGQSGALNESFSDYFGNVIGNEVKGTDSVAIFEGGCTGYTEETVFCTRNPDGSLSLRYMLTGNDFDDYLRALDPGYRLKLLGFSSQDQGGVHFNSAIWNNALWAIRVNLAKIDGKPGNESKLAQAFDRVVYAALTTRLGPTSGFLDARAAVEQVIVDTGLDPVVLRTAREVFDANKICAGCPDTGELGGDTVSASPATQLHPVVSRDNVAWLDVSGDGDNFGFLASTKVGGASPILGGSSNVAEVAFGGDALITLDLERRHHPLHPRRRPVGADRPGALRGGAGRRAGRLRRRVRLGAVRRHGLLHRCQRPGQSGTGHGVAWRHHHRARHRRRRGRHRHRRRQGAGLAARRPGHPGRPGQGRGDLGRGVRREPGGGRRQRPRGAVHRGRPELPAQHQRVAVRRHDERQVRRLGRGDGRARTPGSRVAPRRSRRPTST